MLPFFVTFEDNLNMTLREMEMCGPSETKNL